MSRMARTPTTRLVVDRLLDGQLKATLRRYREAGTPWVVISRLLQTDYGIEITASTLRSWGKDFGLVADSEPENVA